MNKIDLVIVGAQKAGTTALKNYLGEHPEIISHPQEEFAYFKDDREFSEDYSSVFNRYFKPKKSDSSKKVVAKTAASYYSEKAIKRIYEHNPKSQIIFVVREPVERTYSAYCMEYYRGWLNREFNETTSVIESGNFQDTMYRTFVYLSLYDEHLKMILHTFPKKQVHVLKYEDFKDRPIEVCQSLFQLLDVDMSFEPNISKQHNITSQPKSKILSQAIIRLRRNKGFFKKASKAILPYNIFTHLGNRLIDFNKSNKKPPPVPAETAQYLKTFFKPHNQRLQQLTGLDLSEWNN